MVELKTKTVKLKFPVEKSVRAVFPRKLVMYLRHKEDPFSVLISLVILDFQKQRMSHVVSYSPDNMKAMEPHHADLATQTSVGYHPRHNPHGALQFKKKGHVLVFVEFESYIYWFDYAKNRLKIFAITDLAGLPGYEINRMCCTVFPNEDEPGTFYTSMIAKNLETETWEMVYAKVDAELEQMEFIQRVELTKTLPAVPHMTRRVGNWLVSSNFYSGALTNSETGTFYENTKEYMRYVFDDLYKEYCAETGKKYDSEEFTAANIIEQNNVVLEAGFQKFCDTKGANFLNICEQHQKYHFKHTGGEITAVHLETKEVQQYHTTRITPAHFELDEEAQMLYVSSHNFTYLDKHYYYGPAAIDKFHYDDSGLTKVGTFSVPDGYRFTTHKVFRYQGKPYICTFGQPNRLFLIDGETMEMLHTEDIGTDMISGHADLREYLNTTNLEWATIKTIEVSEDGQYLLLLSFQHLYVYSFPERKIVQRIRYLDDKKVMKDVNLKDFIKLCTHFSPLYD